MTLDSVYTITSITGIIHMKPIGFVVEFCYNNDSMVKELYSLRKYKPKSIVPRT